MKLTTPPLSTADLEILERESWIDPATADTFGLYRVTSAEGAALVGRADREDYAGLVFPVYWPGDGLPKEYFLRRDHPPLEQHNGTLKPKQKYLAPPGRGNRLLFGPGESTDALTDAIRSIVLVEGLKKLCAAWRLARHDTPQTRFVGCALSGAWNWRGTIGKTGDATGMRVDVKGAIPDLDRVTWTDRKVLVLFDSDASTNPSVGAARHGLVAELRRRGAHVTAPDLPALDETDKTGFDDLLARNGPVFALQWLASVQETPPTETEAEVVQLAALSPLEYGRARKEASKRWGVPVSFVDKEVRAQQKEKKERESGPILETITPAAHPVDGAELANTITMVIRRFVVLDNHSLVAVVLWVFWSYAFNLWGVAPFLALISPEKRCGKTSLLIILSKLLDRVLLSSNISAAAIFRVIEAVQPTLLIDEMDSFTEGDEALRGILNSGHTKAGARAIRVQGEQMDVKVYSTWCPKAVATIGTLPDTITDRSVPVHMKRRAPGEQLERLRWSGATGAALHEQLKSLAGQCKRWVEDHASDLLATTPKVPDALNDRAADNWFVLLCVAEILGPAWRAKAEVAAVVLNGCGLTESDSIRTQLLRDIKTIIDGSAGDEGIGSQDLCDRLVLIEEAPWSNWRHGKPISANQLARLLKPFGVVSRDRRTDTGVRKGYLFDSLKDAFARYLPHSGQENPISDRDTATTLSGRDDDPLSQSTTKGACSGSENTRILSRGAECSGVAVQNQIFWEEETVGEKTSGRIDLDHDD